jgi:hypothetical protein
LKNSEIEVPRKSHLKLGQTVRLCPDRRSDGAHSPSAGELRRSVFQLGAKPIGSCKALEWTRTSYSAVILKLVEVVAGAAGFPRRAVEIEVAAGGSP